VGKEEVKEKEIDLFQKVISFLTFIVISIILVRQLAMTAEILYKVSHIVSYSFSIIIYIVMFSIILYLKKRNLKRKNANKKV